MTHDQAVSIILDRFWTNPKLQQYMHSIMKQVIIFGEVKIDTKEIDKLLEDIKNET